MSLFPRFSQREYERRNRLVKEMMNRMHLQGLILYGSTLSMGTVTYLSNYITRSPTFLLYPIDGEPVLITNFYNHIPAAKAMSIVEDVRWHMNEPARFLMHLVSEKNLENARVGIVGLSSIPYSLFSQMKSMLPNTQFVDVAEEYNWIRWIRSDEEVDWFRKSAYLTDLTVRALEKKIRPGLTEHDLNAIVYDSFIRQDGQLWVDMLTTTSMEDPKVFCPWPFPTSRVVENGNVVITEITVGYYSYNAQIHRPFAVGKKPSEVYQKLFDTALECFEKVSKVLKPGATTKEVMEATSVIRDNGFTVYDSLVHGEAAKNPELWSKDSFHPKEDFTFRENMVVIIQPQPITIDHKAGLQLGAATVIKPEGAVNLHTYPFKFPVCNGD